VAVDALDYERVEPMVLIARKALESFANAQTTHQIARVHALIGGADRTGMLVRLARLDLNGDGHLSLEAFASFMTETAQLFDGLKRSVLVERRTERGQRRQRGEWRQ
jgi:prophage maintenance system killer protein